MASDQEKAAWVQRVLGLTVPASTFLRAEVVINGDLDEEGGTAAASSPPSRPATSPVRAAPPASTAQTTRPQTGSVVALAKSVLAWDATRKALMEQLHKLEVAILEQAADESDFESIKNATPALDDVLARLDTRLSGTLNAIYTTTDPTERARLRQQAKSIVTDYQAYIAAEPLMAALDSNPFVPFDASSQVRQTLATIDAYL